jgi:hypothetical protein
MAEGILHRRGFLRQLCSLPMLGGSVALLGAPTAVAEPITPDLFEAYDRWLTLERYFLMEEKAQPTRGQMFSRPPRPSFVGWSTSEIAGYRRAEENMIRVEDEFRAEWCHFRARAKLGVDLFKSPVDRHYLSDEMAIVSPPASTRAALVLSAVGINWRGQ